MSKKLWSAGFRKKLHPEAERFTESFSFDRRLAHYDIKGSIAHTRMLMRTGIIPGRCAKKIISALLSIRLEDIRRNSLPAEDIHTYIENMLTKKLGTTAKYLHTGRSRNDQVQLDTRLYVKDETDEIIKRHSALQKSLLRFAERNRDIIIPGFTHLQHAQPVLIAHHILAYINMLERDKERFRGLLRRVDILPLGSGALAGSGLPLDRRYLAKELGFSRISRNSMDSVSDRDYLAELLAYCAITGIHLSRLSEEIVLWASKEFGFITIDESLSTGSSLMPQKKNPDIAELVRAKTGRLNGNLICLLTILKGLPLSYNRDLQEDKPPVFDSVDTIKASLGITAVLIKGIKVNKKHLEDMLEKEDSFLATDLVDSLVRKGVPFRDAYAQVGRLIQKGASIRAYCSIKTPAASVSAKRTQGSTNPKMAAGEIAAWKRRLSDA